MISAGIVGGTGYTGVELIRLLSVHPEVELTYLTSRSEAGKAVAQLFPSLQEISNLTFSDLDLRRLQDCDVVFFATPHGVAMQYAQALLDSGTKIIDLAADFRLQSVGDFEHWYGQTHLCPELVSQAVYGLCEINREKIASAKIVANPGCYPTTAILGLKPVIDQQNKMDRALVDSRIVIDAKSGVSGAGRQAKLALNFSEISENFSAYGVSGHRHLPEIQQGVDRLLGSRFTHKIRFVPHLVPMIRGMFTTVHLSLSEAGKNLDWQAIFEATYANEPFIQVLKAGNLPDTRSVRGSNLLKIAVHQDKAQAELTILVVQDNLLKGASGQAVQNLNCLFGLAETTGLLAAPIFP